MNCTYDGEYRIIVYNNSKLHISDFDNNPKTTNDRSNITTINPEFEFEFLVNFGAEFIMKNSELSECGYGWGTDGEAGLTIKSNNSIIDNSYLHNNYCIYFYYTNNNIISNNSIYSNDLGGIYFTNSSNNQILNNNIFSNTLSALTFTYSSNNQILNNDVSNHEFSIIFSISNHNNIKNTSVNLNIYSAVRLMDSRNIQFINSSISNSDIHDLYLEENSDITTINSTFNKNKFFFSDENSELIVKWYLNIKVVDNYNFTIPNPNVGNSSISYLGVAHK